MSLEYWDEWNLNKELEIFFKTSNSNDIKKLYEQKVSYEEFMKILLNKGYLNIN